jgi:F-type H+-transporting ATPase subunit a
MANPVLHIKDSYYFEVPKMLYPVEFDSLQDFTGAYETWVSLDEDYQEWHFRRVYELLEKQRDKVVDEQQIHLALGLDSPEDVYKLWRQWQHADHANFGKPFDEFLEATYERHVQEHALWKAALLKEREQERDEAKKSGAHFDKDLYTETQEADLDKYLNAEKPDLRQFSQWRNNPQNAETWKAIRREANDVSAFLKYCRENKLEWKQEKLDAYNYHLSGKILIPQPFGKLRNLYERHPANHWYELCISKFMIIEVVVALIIIAAFSWLGRKVASGGAPKGKLWNLLEAMVVFIRDQVAEPAIGHHDAHRFLPYLWTLFFFVLGCNLMGLIPWAGSPTGTFGVTLSFAMLTLFVSVSSSMARFGFFGFFKNLVPHMDVSILIKVFIFPMLLLIEGAGLLIKHGVLAIRLLANMVAGHLVLLAIMGIAFSTEAVARMTGLQWGIAAVISIAGCTALSLLELIVAFLQAYIITFLSAMWIGMVLHEH